MRERPGDRSWQNQRCMICTVPIRQHFHRRTYVHLRQPHTVSTPRAVGYIPTAVIHGTVGISCGCHEKLGYMAVCDGCPHQLICMLRDKHGDAEFYGNCAFLERLDQMDIDETIAYLDSIGVRVEKLDGPGHPLYTIDGEVGMFLEREVIAYAQSR